MAIDTEKFRRVVIESTLRGCPLFAGLATADIETLAGFAVPKQLEKGDYLFHEGDPSIGFYIVQKGAINLHRMSANGKEQTLHLFCPVESFAEGTLAEGVEYPATARATEATTVLLVPRGQFVDLLGRRPDLAMRMLGSMSQHLRVLVGLVEDLTLKDVETRLANWLLKRCRSQRKGSIDIKLDRTKRVLAAEMGTTSETLSRTLAKFRDRKLLRVNGKTITVTQPLALEELLRQHLGDL